MIAASERPRFSNDVRERVSAQTASLMNAFEKEQNHLHLVLEELPTHFSLVISDDIRDDHNSLVRAILASTSAKYVTLSMSLVEAVNKYDFLTYALVARSVMEAVAALRYALNQMRPIIHEMASTGKYTPEHVRDLLTHERAYLMGTRFDWLEFFQTGFRRLNENYVEGRSDQKQNKKAKLNPERVPQGQINAYTFIEKWATPG